MHAPGMLVCRWHATMTEAVCVFQQRMHPDASGQSMSLTIADRTSLAGAMSASEPHTRGMQCT